VLLAASHAHGLLTYFVLPEHTALARTIVGEGKWVCAEQAVLLETDPEAILKLKHHAADTSR
jgi:hypothetical protein